VCHQAGMVGLGVDFGDATSYVRDNDLGWATGLGAMHRLGFEGRVVLASSMVVYGEGAYRCAEHGTVRPPPRDVARLRAGRFEPACVLCGGDLVPESIAEDAPLEPRNVYAATKLHQEHLTAAFAREHAVDACWLRYHNVYGPRMPRNTPYAGVASVFRSALERGEAPHVNEDGAQLRDFVHVRDVARANVAALVGERIWSGPVNIASGSPRRIIEMAERLATALGYAPGSAQWPRITGEHRLGDVRHVFAATALASERLGLQPRETFEAGVAEFATAPLRESQSAFRTDAR